MKEGKTNAEALAITEGIVLNTEESTDVLKIYNYAFTVPSIEDESYTVIIYASDTNGQSASKEITVSNDKEAPKFDSVASITPYVDVEEGDGGNKKIVQKVNGLVNIKQLISDNVKVEKNNILQENDIKEESINNCKNNIIQFHFVNNDKKLTFCFCLLYILTSS